MEYTYIDRLPDELLTLILKYVITSTVPFDIDHVLQRASLVEKIRFDRTECRELKISLPMYVKVGTSKATPEENAQHGAGLLELAEKNNRDLRSPNYFQQALLNVVLPKQREHLIDWSAVNTMSRRFRAIGRLMFFKHKILIFTYQSLKKFSKGTANGISVTDQALALRTATTVIIRCYNKVVDFQKFPRVPDQFPRLQRLGFDAVTFNLDRMGCEFLVDWDANVQIWDKVPERLEVAWRRLGLCHEKVKVNFLHNQTNPHKVKVIMGSWVEHSMLAQLEACATFYEKTQMKKVEAARERECLSSSEKDTVQSEKKAT